MASCLPKSDLLAEPHVFVGSFVILAALSGLSRGGKLGFQLWRVAALFVFPGRSFVFTDRTFYRSDYYAQYSFRRRFGFLCQIIHPFQNFLSRFKKSPKKTSTLPQRVIKFSGMASSNTPPPPQQKLPLLPAFPASSFRPSTFRHRLSLAFPPRPSSLKKYFRQSRSGETPKPTPTPSKKTWMLLVLSLKLPRLIMVPLLLNMLWKWPLAQNFLKFLPCPTI